MIGYLQGQVLDQADSKVLVGMGSAGAGVIGYLVTVPHPPGSPSLELGQKIELFIHTHVREDALDLFGFFSQTDKNLFLILLEVSGIGPKSAISILSSISSAHLIDAILKGDQAGLTRVPGIGKKTAERVIVELKDSIRKKLDQGILKRTSGSPLTRSLGLAGMEGETASLFEMTSTVSHPQIFEDARSALMGLGFREHEVLPVLNKILAEPGGRAPDRAEDLVRIALRHFA